MKKATLSKASAESFLGSRLAREFKSFVSDARVALSLEEMLGEPRVFRCEGRLQLAYRLSSGAEIEIRPLSVTGSELQGWKSAHRIELVRVLENGTVRL